MNKEFIDLYKSIGLSSNEASAELNMILDFLNINSLKSLINGYSKEELHKINLIVEKRIKTREPLQYILGFGYFMGEKYIVDKNTLIPRPETEILVRECAKLVNRNSKILDIGTGTGCIAIELNKLTKAKVHACDISEQTLSVAQKNADKLKAECKFIKSDLFENITQKYDLIVSNPPYIPIGMTSTLDVEVKNFEPHAALFTKDEHGIEFYEKIIQNSLTFLNKNGHLAFELGIGQSSFVTALFKEFGFTNIKIYKDLDNIERVTIAKYF